MKDRTINIAGSIVFFFIALFAYTKLAGPVPFSVTSVVTQKTDTFTVSGEGKSSITPDIAVVRVGVQSTGQSVSVVQKELNAKINAITDAVKKLGVEDKDVQTTNYNIYPTYDYREGSTQRITGYTSNTSLTIKARAIDKANELIDAATANGANVVEGISFEVSDKNKAENEAREKAVEQARTKAAEAARIAGFSLGKLINYSESFGNDGGPVPMYAKAEAAVDMGGGDTRIQPGTTDITVNVALSFEIQ